MRKEYGLEITDRISVSVSKNEATDEAIALFTEHISNQVLADTLTLCDGMEGGEEVDLDGIVLRIAIAKI